MKFVQKEFTATLDEKKSKFLAFLVPYKDFDKRLVDLKSDFYIIPSFDDYESISESMRTAHYILKNNIKAKIIFVLNGAFIVDKTTKDEKIKEFQEHIEVNGFNRFTTLFLPKTALMRKLVDENTKKDDLKNKFEQNIKYKNVDKFVDELVGLITVHYS